MEFHVITLFPEMFESPFRGGMIGRAVEQGLIAIKAHPLREHGLGNYRQVDDAPYGGGSGMVMRPEPIAAAIDAVNAERPGLWRILMTPQGEVFDNSMARDLAKLCHIHNRKFRTCAARAGRDASAPCAASIRPRATRESSRGRR